MLYGNKEIRKAILLKAKELSVQYDIEIIFGANLGSISKGIPRYYSDYDTRFLFIRKSFMDKDFTKIFDWPVVSEKNIVYRYFPEDMTLFYDRIPLWDCETFFRFLSEPRIGDNVSYGLYHMLGWTLGSPFLWDPYGLSNKVLPILNQHINIGYEINYWEQYLSERLCRSNMGLKEYMDCIHAALSATWILTYREFPPVYIDTLLTMEGINVFADKIRKYNMNLRNVFPCKEAMDEPIAFVSDVRIDDWLCDILERCRTYIQQEFNNNIDDCKKGTIQILDIIQGSLNPYGINKIDNLKENGDY